MVNQALLAAADGQELRVSLAPWDPREDLAHLAMQVPLDLPASLGLLGSVESD